MKFTYDSYRKLIGLLRQGGYSFADYHTYAETEHPVILRHDIDISIEKSVTLAELEQELGVKSTWFVLVTSDFYNAASRHSRECLLRIKHMGHEIGLHFDETAYGPLDADSMTAAILKEREMLQNMTEIEISSVSMHRPSKWVLEADLKIPGMVNSYGREFFHDFKYVSDSRMRWREDVMKYALERTYPRLHILTHAFWYNDEELSLHDALDGFLSAARKDRYGILNGNFTDLPLVISEQEP